MANNQKNPAEQAQASVQQPQSQQAIPDIKSLPKEAQDKLAEIKNKLDLFKRRVNEKLGKYATGIALLPPERPQEGKKVDTQRINVLVLVDDSDSQKLNKVDLKDRLYKVVDSIALGIDKNIAPQVILLSELWQSCFDAKYDVLQLISVSAPVSDTGMLGAVKIAEIHKTMVLKKFEKYIVSYVLSGSLVRGEATEKSDIDVMVIIDDTDVKKMTRAELKDKLRAIIIGMGIEAGEITGIRNKLNIQVYILTDFWDSLREANPVIFTLLRDGIPFYDRGIFMPWKQLLKMGKIKPSAEAIDMFMSSGEQMISRIKYRLKEMAMEDCYYAILTPSQAALMLHGMPPPSPRETAKLMREIFVKKEKLLEEKYIKILETVIQIRKDIEHGTKTEFTGKELDKLLLDADDYLKRVNSLFKEIDDIKAKESILHVYESVVTIIRDILRLEGVEKVKDTDIVETFEKEMVHKGFIPEKYLRVLNDIIKGKKDYDDGKLTKSEVEKIKSVSNEFIKFMVEYMQRKRGRELERTKIRVKHGNRYGEVLLLDNLAFIIHDIDHEEKELSKAIINPDGSLGILEPSSLEELEKHLTAIEIPSKVFIKEKIFDNLKNIFGKDVEILINY